MANLVCDVLVTEAPLEAPPQRQSADAREMAEHQLRRIAEQAAENFGLRVVLIHHRIGFIAVGAPSLFLRVTSLHREEAFRASQWIVDELKKKVPIWKKPRLRQGYGVAGAPSQEAMRV